MWKWVFHWFAGFIFLLFGVISLIPAGDIRYNGTPYTGQRWVFLAFPLLYWPVLGTTMGVRIRVTQSSLLLRSAFWPASRILLKTVAKAEVNSREGSVWRMWGTFWRLDGLVPLKPKDFTAAGAGVVRVEVDRGKPYLIAARDPDALVAVIESARRALVPGPNLSPETSPGPNASLPSGQP